MPASRQISTAIGRSSGQYGSAALTCTVLGYGISTTPELAAFANSALVRAMDFNDTGGARGTGQAGHPSDLITAALAIGEAIHSTVPYLQAANQRQPRWLRPS